MENGQSNSESQLSRRERREMKRTEQRSQQSGLGRRRALRRFLLWGGFAVLVAAIGWLVVRAAGNVSVPQSDGVLGIAVTARDHVKGPADAPITVVEYGDFQCPACAAYVPLVKAVLEDESSQGKVRFVFRHFPLTNIHKNAEQASFAAEAAGLQGKFWEYHDLLFAGQTKWSAMSVSGAGGQFEEYAGTLGLDIERWKRDRDSDAVKQRVKDDAQGGLDAGVDSTPTFFANGRQLPPPASSEAFRSSILNAAPAATPDATP